MVIIIYTYECVYQQVMTSGAPSAWQKRDRHNLDASVPSFTSRPHCRGNNSSGRQRAHCWETYRYVQGLTRFESGFFGDWRFIQY